MTLLTLNIAHGRKDGRNQMLQRTATIRRNLDDITRLLAQTSPALVALQEADGPSFWSGKFDHVKYLAKQAEFPPHRPPSPRASCWPRSPCRPPRPAAARRL